MNYKNAKVYNAALKTDECGFRVQTDIAIEALPCDKTKQSTSMSSPATTPYKRELSSAPGPIHRHSEYPFSYTSGFHELPSVSNQNLASFLIDLLFTNDSVSNDVQDMLIARVVSLCESIPLERRTESLENLMQELEEINTERPEEIPTEQDFGIPDLISSLLDSLPQEIFTRLLQVILNYSRAIPGDQRTPSLEALLQQLNQNPEKGFDTEWSESYAGFNNSSISEGDFDEYSGTETNYSKFNPMGWATKHTRGSIIFDSNFDKSSGAEKIEVLVASPVQR